MQKQNSRLSRESRYRVFLPIACRSLQPLSPAQFWPQLLGEQADELTDAQRHRLLVLTLKAQDQLVKEGLGSWQHRKPGRGKPVKVFVPNWKGLALEEFQRFNLILELSTPEHRHEILRSFAEFVEFAGATVTSAPNQSLAS